MRKSFIILLLLFKINSFGQSIEETKQWILEKHNEYQYNLHGDYFRSEYNLKFRDGYLYYESTRFANYAGNNPIEKFCDRIKIKDVRQIKIYLDKDFNSVYVDLYLDKSQKKDHINYTNGETNYRKGSNNIVGIRLKDNFIEEGMKERMEKALQHLVKLYGGSATFYKEAF